MQATGGLCLEIDFSARLLVQDAILPKKGERTLKAWQGGPARRMFIAAPPRAAGGQTRAK
jgi:hypothetical protein